MGGKEFKSIWFEQLFARYQCVVKSREGKPRFGSHIERYFGATTTELLYNLQGNTQPTKIGRQMTRRNDPRRHAVWTLAALAQAFEKYLETYDQRNHPALGVSLLEAFNASRQLSGSREGRRVVYDASFQISTLPSTNRGMVTLRHNKPIQIKNVEYWHPLFRNAKLHGESVPVRYDPFDIGVAFFYANNVWNKCQAVFYEEYRNRTERELQLATEEYRQTLRNNNSSKNVNLRKIAGFISKLEEKEAILLEQKSQLLDVVASFVSEDVDEIYNPEPSRKKIAVARRRKQTSDPNVLPSAGFSWGFDSPIPEDF